MTEKVGVKARSQRLILTILFGVIIFISKIVIPTPMDKFLIVIQALFLALGSLTMKPFGATFVSMVGGFLTALWRAPLAIFTIAFALIYGLLVDGLTSTFKVKTPGGAVRTGRLVAAVTLSTAIVGLTSYFVTSYILVLLPRNLLLEVFILAGGLVNGFAGGYLAVLIWKRALRNLIV